jgi:hypothetical protein
MEMNAVSVRAAVRKTDAHDIALGGAQRRAWDPTIITPGRKEHARRNLNLLVQRRHREFAELPAIRQGRDSARIPVGKDLVRVKPITHMVDLADRHHRAVARSLVPPMGIHGRRLGRNLSDRRSREEKGCKAAKDRAAEKPAAA